MDEIDNNKEKTFIGKMKSSNSNAFSIASPKISATSSFRKAYYDVDIDSVEKESNNHNNSDFKVNREVNKLEFQRNLKRKLSDLKTKNQYNDFSFNTKIRNHNVSLKDDIVINESLSICTNNQELGKLKTNYRTLCDFERRKPAECISSPQNPLNNSGFLSMSRQSLNESLNESGISSTASRIAANIQNKSNSQKTDALNKTSSNLCSKSFSMKARRYRTIMKKDKFSSYLTRVPIEDSLFNVPNLGTSNVILNLNCSENPAKRVDFSFAHVFHGLHNNKVVESNNSNIYWTCVNCNSSNPSNFNFCPTCSTSNPKLVLNEKNFKPIINDNNKNIWVCSRCSTKNEECRLVCVFCFKNKNFSTKKPKLDINNDENFVNNSKTGFNFIETNSVNMDFNFESNNKLVDKSSKHEEDIPGKSRTENDCDSKWNCSVCLAENKSEWAKCACCSAANPNKAETQQSKPNFVFGNSNICTESPAVIKFGTSGTNLDCHQPKPLSSFFLFGGSQSTQNESSTPKFVTFGAKWNCGECWAENEAEREKCACCSSARDNSHSINDKSIKSQFGSSSNYKNSIKFGTLERAVVETTSEKWSCSECWVENDGDKEKCACCKTARNSSVTKQIDSASIDSGQSIKFGSICSNQEEEQQEQVGKSMNSNKKSWNCCDCWAENEAEREKCACCGGRRSPAINKEEKSMKIQFGSSIDSKNVPKQTQIVPQFQFGISKPINNSNNNYSVTMATSVSTISRETPIFPHQNGIDKIKSIKSTTKWECQTCLVENEESIESCAACCQARKPQQQQQQPSNSNKEVANIVPIGLFDFSKKQSQSTFKFGCNSNSDLNNRNSIDNCKQIDNLLNFTFSPPHYLPDVTDDAASSSSSSSLLCSQQTVPIDLVFEFAAPKFL